MRKGAFFMALATVLVSSSSYAAGVLRITEFMSEGQGLTGPGTGANRQREFFEVTNVGDASVDMTGFSYNDNNTNDPINFGAQIGMVAAHESIIFTQMAPADFTSYWQLPSSVRVFTFGQLSNLGNADTINIYNSTVQNSTTLVDSISYTSDLRGSGISRNRPVVQNNLLGQFPNAQWLDSYVGDSFTSRLAPNPVFPAGPEYVDLANPGYYPVPEPASVIAIAAGCVALIARRRKA